MAYIHNEEENLGGFGDVISTIGGAIGWAGKQIGTGVSYAYQGVSKVLTPDVLKSLTKIGGQYLSTQLTFKIQKKQAEFQRKQQEKLMQKQMELQEKAQQKALEQQQKLMEMQLAARKKMLEQQKALEAKAKEEKFKETFISELEKQKALGTPPEKAKAIAIKKAQMVTGIGGMPYQTIAATLGGGLLLWLLLRK